MLISGLYRLVCVTSIHLFLFAATKTNAAVITELQSPMIASLGADKCEPPHLSVEQMRQRRRQPDDHNDEAAEPNHDLIDPPL